VRGSEGKGKEDRFKASRKSVSDEGGGGTEVHGRRESETNLWANDPVTREGKTITLLHKGILGGKRDRFRKRKEGVLFRPPQGAISRQEGEKETALSSLCTWGKALI